MLAKSLAKESASSLLIIYFYRTDHANETLKKVGRTRILLGLVKVQ